ncbi:MAG: winged helix-turn-helix domain-containing protein [Carbonactinosporaceae bacterium]
MTDPDNPPTFDLSGVEFVYLQVADYIESLIFRGVLRAGTRLPPERELAERYGVAYATIRRAMAELRERGLIRSQHGRGTYVVERT